MPLFTYPPREKALCRRPPYSAEPCNRLCAAVAGTGTSVGRWKNMLPGRILVALDPELERQCPLSWMVREAGVDAPIGRGQQQVAPGGEQDTGPPHFFPVLGQHDPVRGRRRDRHRFPARRVHQRDPVAALRDQALDVVPRELAPVCFHAARGTRPSAAGAPRSTPSRPRRAAPGRPPRTSRPPRRPPPAGTESPARGPRAARASASRSFPRPPASSSSPGSALDYAGRGWLPPAPGD